MTAISLDMEHHKAFKFRFYPTVEQAEQLNQTFGCVRFVYNWGLAVRKNAFENFNIRLSAIKQITMLTQLKKAEGQEFLNEISSVPLQQALRHLGAAYEKFFKGQTAYPNFKKKNGKQSASYTSNAFSLKNKQLKIAKHKEPLNVRWSKDIKGTPTSLTISKDKANRYFVSILCKVEIPFKPVVNKTVGLDLGLSHFCIDSNGQKIANPYFYKHLEYKLKKAQQNLSRKVKFSNNWNKAKYKVAKIHAKISDCRKDFLHKLSSHIVNENQVMCVETLKVKNMQQNHKLAKAISDSSWATFLSMLEYKYQWYGREFSQIDQWYPSSKTCSVCGIIRDKLPLHIRQWECECGTIHDRDINAARNILRVGLAQLACGDGVRPIRSLRMKRIPSVKQESQKL